MSAQHILYQVFYDDILVYLGRTNQPLQRRLHGHFFNTPMHRKLDLKLASKIRFATFKTKADMFVYEVYFINKLKPLLNCDDLSESELTISLPDVEWADFDLALKNKWLTEIQKCDKTYARFQAEANRLFTESLERRRAGDLDAYEELRDKCKSLRKARW